MRSFHVTQALITAAAVMLVGGVAPGCGPSVSGYCNRICDCVGCSSVERQDCVDSVEDVQKEAADKGCSSQFNALFSCVNSELTCVNGEVEADGCTAELEDLVTCGGGGIVVNVGAANVAACKELYATINSLPCIGDVQLDDSACDAYKDTTCDVTSYFDCVGSHYVCVNGALDPDELQKAADCPVPNCP